MQKNCYIRWTITAFVFLTAAFVLSSTHHPSASSQNRIVADTLPTLAGEEWGPANEDQINQIVQASEKMLNTATGDSHLMRRDAHPKQHGCARAYFDIDSAKLPPQYRVGVFAPPKDGQTTAHHLAWTRFSNGSPNVTAGDLDKDIRGFAIKLMNVEGSDSGSQDFVLSTSPAFFSKNGEDYVGFNKAISDGNLMFLPWLAVHPETFYLLQKSRVQIANVLQTKYFSTTPYRLGGENSMRFSVTPCESSDPLDSLPEAKTATPNFLRERLVSRLKTGGDACFNFYVQPNQKPETAPVEDPTLIWSETDSPIYWVGKITFPGHQGDIDSDAQNALCENLSFSPWHTLQDTRPLGQINRIRKVVYATISRDRHQHNGVALEEPRDFYPCQHGSALCQEIAP